MFNLNISKRNHSEHKRKGMVTTLHSWTINGKVVDKRETEKGYWLKVKTDAKLSQLYSFNRLEFDCYLSKDIAATAYKKESYFKKLHAVGKFVFKKDESYFMVERLLL